MEMYIKTLNRAEHDNVDILFRMSSKEEKIELLDYLDTIDAKTFVDSGVDVVSANSFLLNTFNMYFCLRSSKATFVKVNLPLRYLLSLRTMSKHSSHVAAKSLVNNIKLCINDWYGAVGEAA